MLQNTAQMSDIWSQSAQQENNTKLYGAGGTL